MKVDRTEFFEQFMAMFAGPNLRVTQEGPDSIVGELTWDSAPDYVEEVRWDCAESDVPSFICFQLASFIAQQELLDIDMIPLSRRELHESFSKHTQSTVSFSAFESVLDELLAIEIPRLEDGEEFDAFFVHE